MTETKPEPRASVTSDKAPTLDEIDRLPAARIAYRSILLVALLLVVGLMFKALATLILATLITVIVAIPLGMCADRAERMRLPQAIGALAALLLGLGVVTATLAVVIPRFVEQASALINDLPGVITSLQDSIGKFTGRPADNTTGNGDELQAYLRRFLANPQAVLAPLATLSLGVVSAVTTALLILLTAFYMAVNPAPLVNGTLKLFPPSRRPWARTVLNRLRDAWIGWMQGVAVDMVITGVLLYFALTLIGMPFAIVFALLSALLVIIPYYGSIIGAVPPVLFALADSPSLALLTLGVYVLVQQIESNIIIPLVMANRVNLHPAPIAIGVLIIGQLFGFAGLFVAVPVLCTLIVLVDELWGARWRPAAHRGSWPEPPAPVRRVVRLQRITHLRARRAGKDSSEPPQAGAQARPSRGDQDGPHAGAGPVEA